MRNNLITYKNLNCPDPDLDCILKDTFKKYTPEAEIESDSILVTYAELLSLITASKLKPNAKYKITDYATVHYLVDSLGGKHGINTGVNEPLLLTAISNNEFDKVAQSLLYPKDIIHYDINSANYLTNEAFSTAGVIVEGFKGVIYFRHDTINNNQVGNDFRNVRSRRWECNPPTWDGITTYGAKAFVKYNGWLYASYSAGVTRLEYVNGSNVTVNVAPNS